MPALQIAVVAAWGTTLVLLTAATWWAREEIRAALPPSSAPRGWLAILVLAVAFAGSLALLPGGPLRLFDELSELLTMQMGLPWSGGAYRPAAFPSTLVALGSVAPVGVTTAQVLNVTLTLATFLVVYLLGRVAFRSGRAGLLGGLAFALLPLVGRYATTADYHVLGNAAFLLAALGTLLFLRAPRPRLAVFAALTVALAAQTKAYGLILPPLLLPFFVVAARKGRLRLWMAISLLALVAALCAPWAYDITTGVLAEARQARVDPGVEQVVTWTPRGIWSAFVSLVAHPRGAPHLVVLGLLGAVWLGWRREWGAVLLTVGGAVLLVFVAFGVHRSDAGSHPQQLLVPLALIAVLAGGGMSAVIASTRSWARLSVVLLLVAAVAVSVATGALYFQARDRTDPLREVVPTMAEWRGSRGGCGAGPLCATESSPLVSLLPLEHRCLLTACTPDAIPRGPFRLVLSPWDDCDGARFLRELAAGGRTYEELDRRALPEGTLRLLKVSRPR